MSSEEYHIVRVGKGGLTDSVVKEIMRQLKEKKIIKVKFMKSIVSNKKQFNEIIDNLLKKLPDAVIKKKVGHTVVIALKR